MPSLATLVMIAWIPLILVSFSLARPRRAVITAYLAGWMLLPIMSWDLPGLPSYDKLTATNLGVFAAILLFDLRTLLRLRPSALDLPVAILCLCPIASSLSNGLGLYDGLAGAWQKIISWSIPWVVGRCYFGSMDGMRELAIGMFVAGALYVPLCVFEMVYGATLHLKVYGFSQHLAEQTIRTDGSIRPMVFMPHGLIVSIWMGSCALAGLSLRRGARLGRLLARFRPVLLVGLITTLVLSRSLAAMVLTASGYAAWSASRITRSLLPVMLLVAIVPTYVTLRGTGTIARAEMSAAISSGMEALGVSQAEISARVASATVRFIGEDELCKEGWQHPVFGANPWNVGLAVDAQTGEAQSTTVDGLWAILFATRGIVGLGAWMLMMFLPVIVFARRHPPGTWNHPRVSPASILAIVLTAHALDSLLNADGTPMYNCIAGGLAGLPAARGFKHAAPAV